MEKFSESLKEAALSSSQNISQICEALIEEKSRAKTEIQNEELRLLELEASKKRVQESIEGKALEEHLNRVLKNFDKRSDFQKKRIIQAVVPEIIVHNDNRIELKVSLDPVDRGSINSYNSGLESPCHTGGQEIGFGKNGGVDTDAR